MINQAIEKIFCGKCGRECIYTEESASKYRVYYPHLDDYSQRPSEFSSTTGERNIIGIWTCPNRRYPGKNFWGKTVMKEDKDHYRIIKPINFRL